ncbi:hypothetical protein AYK26_02545 [Euryarchaeota archaeon SM23-78]|nr:MAG: hypothetical protein AYK26_02545 [Euryarchaeota archaeon SM23-78]MBW3000251.1 hypothetical protein [Candidatus Woesearchaeota archaeon]
MKLDIVMPKDNEQELIEIAEKLGFKELIFLYEDLKEKPKKLKSNKIKTWTAGLVKNIKEVDKAKKNFDFLFGVTQRNFFENKKVKYLINAEISESNDFVYQRRAGLDDVMCRLAKEKDKVIVFNTKLLTTDKHTYILGRMMQNAKLCRKYKIKTLIATLASTPLEMRAPKDLDGLARMLKLL